MDLINKICFDLQKKLILKLKPKLHSETEQHGQVYCKYNNSNGNANVAHTISTAH